MLSLGRATNMLPGGRLREDPSTISNLFNHHFSSIGNSLVSSPLLTCNSFSASISRSSFSFGKILPAEVKYAVNKLKDDSGSGQNGIETKLNQLPTSWWIHFVTYLTYLFLLTLSCLPGNVDICDKCDTVTPLYKGGDPLDINNYHPISIINSVAKIFEKLIFNQLSHYVTDFNVLFLCQSGFRPNFSTITALLNFTNDSKAVNILLLKMANSLVQSFLI